MELLEHMHLMKKSNTLPPQSQPNDPVEPLKTFHIPKGAFDNVPYLVSPPVDQNAIVNDFQAPQPVDPITGLPLPGRIQVDMHSREINDQINLKNNLT